MNFKRRFLARMVIFTLNSPRDCFDWSLISFLYYKLYDYIICICFFLLTGNGEEQREKECAYVIRDVKRANLMARVRSRGTSFSHGLYSLPAPWNSRARLYRARRATA